MYCNAAVSYGAAIVWKSAPEESSDDEETKLAFNLTIAAALGSRVRW